jgi:hypothetical protein
MDEQKELLLHDSIPGLYAQIIIPWKLRNMLYFLLLVANVHDFDVN